MVGCNVLEACTAESALLALASFKLLSSLSAFFREIEGIQSCSEDLAGVTGMCGQLDMLSLDFSGAQREQTQWPVQRGH